MKGSCFSLVRVMETVPGIPPQYHPRGGCSRGHGCYCSLVPKYHPVALQVGLKSKIISQTSQSSV